MQDEPSRTAIGSAVLRAAHVRQDPPPWILEDTLSERFLSSEERGIVLDEIATWPEGMPAGFRLSHVVRSRLAEDVAVEGLNAGRRRYVLLGAGLDSFAWRHRRAAEFEIVEIDHPATQSWKRQRLAERGVVEPPNVRFVPIDLARSPLLAPTPVAPSTWSWMGVTMYLERAAVRDVLRVIADSPTGTTLAVNFLLPEAELDERALVVRKTTKRTVARTGEPIRSTYSRDDCEEMLRAAGFGSVELLDAEALTRRYCAGRPELRMPRTTLVAVAQV